MRNVGRLLTTLGWGWVILGIVGGAFGLDGVNIFPGFILLFVGRAIRRGSRQEEPEEEEEESVEEVATRPRPLNTDRVAPPPERRQEREREIVVEEAADEEERQETLERILDAGLAASAGQRERDAKNVLPIDRDD